MFWQQIASNKRWSFFYSLLMTLLLGAVGAAIAFVYMPDAWYLGGIIAFGIGMMMWAYFTASGHKTVLSLSGAREATHEENQMLVNVGHEMAIAAGIPMPKIYVIDTNVPNAFATGMSPKNGVVCVTKGLLEKLNRDELQGVVAHEIAHIRNYDIRLMTTLALTLGLLVLFRDVFLRSMWYGGGRGRGRDGGHPILAVLAIILVILAPVFAMLLHLAVSRKREYLADATAAELTRYPDGLADALEKIAGDPGKIESANHATEHMYIINPFKKQFVKSGLFATHPPTPDRVRRLRGMGFKGHSRPEPPTETQG